jgi:ABC-2 type transport system ATP-binding protein
VTARPSIVARDLKKHFKVHRRPPGLRSALKSLFRRRYETVKAVDGVSFSIEPGERVGFLGPNGAGKTTTLKVLSGLLHPTSGEAEVAGFVPARREAAFLKTITLVMGQKMQLLWDLPPAETFAMNRAVFGVPAHQYRETLAELTALLGLSELVTKPTRQLSLGERMKCELAAALLHRPTTLFLDEPTIGLDVSMQAAMRDFIRDYNQRHGATVLLTSHYMDDVVALCPRVIVIDRGVLIHDGDLRELVRRVKPHKRVAITLAPDAAADPGKVDAALAKLGMVERKDGVRVVIQLRESELATAVPFLLANVPVADLTIEDPPLEDVMRELFARGGGGEAEPAKAAPAGGEAA